MSLAQAMLDEFEQEVPITRRFLERIPAGKLTWKPHERSMTAGQLALHLAQAPAKVVALAREDLVPMPESVTNPQPTSVEEVLRALDETVAAVREALASFDDARMEATWRLTKDGREVLAVPRAVFLRNILLNHWYQHRGQLGVYLRLLDVKVPASYGPSADEAPDFLQKTQAA